MPESEKEWMNVKEAAEYLQVSRLTIYNLMDKGLLPYSEIQGVRGRRISKDDLDALKRTPSKTEQAKGNKRAVRQ